MAKDKNPKWSDVKREVAKLDNQALLMLVGELYKLSAGNGDV